MADSDTRVYDGARGEGSVSMSSPCSTDAEAMRAEPFIIPFRLKLQPGNLLPVAMSHEKGNHCMGWMRCHDERSGGSCQSVSCRYIDGEGHVNQVLTGIKSHFTVVIDCLFWSAWKWERGKPEMMLWHRVFWRMTLRRNVAGHVIDTRLRDDFQGPRVQPASISRMSLQPRCHSTIIGM